MRKESYREYWIQAQEDLVKDLIKNGIFVTEEQVWAAIQIYCHETFPEEIEFWSDILFIKVEYSILLAYVSAIDFESIKIEFDTTTADIHYSLLLMTKAEVKHNGLIWVVHKNDKDPFPSNPHAHQIDNRFKMHLGNGKIYLKRKEISQLRKKEFLAVREKLGDRGIALPALDI
jgi:hypothetical protein